MGAASCKYQLADGGNTRVCASACGWQTAALAVAQQLANRPSGCHRRGRVQPTATPAAGAVLALLVKLHGGVHKQGAQVGAADADGHLRKE